jgi:hypothetical protein
MYRVIHQDFAHHHPATPIEHVGNWQVYHAADVEYGWPHDGHRLALEATAEQVEYLRVNDKQAPVVVRPLPDVTPEPELIPEPEPEPN